ncbi:MAG: ABC transporter substrate-binding protein, partial [Ruminococcus sp.]|nr:ABC transporter substrate-binding protein [Ruminococcus sp.]MDY6201689.1 ABC transporter substrate-binding protein [Ruminococcus sp.]
MKKSKKVLAVLLAALTMSFALVGCGGSSGSSSEVSGNSSKADADKVYNIGICQLVQHDALDAATKGFKDKLTELLGEDKVTFDE